MLAGQVRGGVEGGENEAFSDVEVKKMRKFLRKKRKKKRTIQ